MLQEYWVLPDLGKGQPVVRVNLEYPLKEILHVVSTVMQQLLTSLLHSLEIAETRR
jgi:hypothetical protein